MDYLNKKNLMQINPQDLRNSKSTSQKPATMQNKINAKDEEIRSMELQESMFMW